MALTSEHATAALRGVRDPDLGKDIVSLGFIKGVDVTGDAVKVKIELTTPGCPHKEVIERDARAVLTQTGFNDIQFEFTARVRSSASSERKSVLPQVKNVIAVGAGKGGVGKSTIAVNLAVGLHRCGAAVGLMDGDIYGPSMPTMLGVKGVTPQVRGSKILPHHVHGIYAVTIGSLVEHDKPLIWRGPMAHGAFKQLLLDNTEWPALDYLIVDLPPGTGDVPLSLCQMLAITGAVVVATPQQVALDDAVRAVRMFQQLEAPILGLVENMSYFIGADGSEHDIFGRGGTERAAQRLGLPYLGALPMFTELRVNCDAGRPQANFAGSPRLKSALETIVSNLAGEVNKRNAGPAGPKLTVQ